MTTPTGQPGADAKALIDKADAALSVYKAIHAEHEGKDMPAAKAAEADAAFAEFETHQAAAVKASEQASRHQKGEDFAAYKARLAESAGRIAVGGLPPMGAGGDDDASVVYKARDGKERRFSPDKSVRNGWTAKAEQGYTSSFRRFIAGATTPEDEAQAVQKALSVGVDAAGGFWVASEVFATEMIEALEDQVLMRQLATVMPSIAQGQRLGFRTATDLTDAEWTSEITTATADTATPAGQRWLTPHPLGKLVLVSTTLLGTNAGAEAYVRGEIANRIAEVEENAGMTGTGAGQWQGIFLSTAPGTDVTCTSATDIAYADLLSVEFTLKANYRTGASWIMHRTILKELHSLVDGNGVPLLRRDPVAGMTHSLFGYTVNESEYAPSSSATGLYVAALGNWKKSYRIVDSLAMKIQRLDELYALTKQVGFVAEKESDGAIVDGNGVVRLKMA